MKLSIGVILCLLVVEVNSQGWLQFMKEAGEGARDMWRAYSDMREANWKGSDRYFRARGNFDAAQRGPGGAWAAKVISDAREAMQIWRGRIPEDSAYYQFPNEWGRRGNNPSIFRPPGLPLKY